MLFGALALRFFQPRGCGHESAGSQTLRRKLASDGYLGLSVLQQFSVFKFFIANFRVVSVANDLHKHASLWHASNTRTAKTPVFTRHIGCSSDLPKYEAKFGIRVPT